MAFGLEGRSRTYGAFDVAMLRDWMAGAGMDTREWVCYGVVDPDGADDDDKSVAFDESCGPLVNVTLHPSGKHARCRVASGVAGIGEGEWFPFVGGDEVLVVMAGGSEHNAVIVGRLNQSIDTFPTLVGGADTTKNSFAFKRVRCPYVMEVASTYMLDSVTTGAMLMLDKGGSWYMLDGAGSTMHVGPDWMGFQTKQGDNLMQLQIKSGAEKFYVHVGGGKAAFALSASDLSAIIVPQILNIGTAGNSPLFHATTIESIANLLVSLGALVPAPAMWTAAQVAAAIAAAAALPLSPVITSAINAGLAVPVAVSKPGIGCAGLVIG